MNILATGVSGTIGKHLPNRVIPVKINLASNKSSFENLHFNSSDILIHCAGVVGNTEIEKDEKLARSINIDGTAHLAQRFKKMSNGLFVYISSSHVYAPTTGFLSEDSQAGPISTYGVQKYKAELALTEIFSESPERLLIIRVFSILDWDTQPYTLGGGIRKLAEGDKVYRLVNADDIRDFLTPKTVAETIYEIAKLDGIFGVYNLCSGFGIKVSDAARRMLTEGGFTVPENQILHGQSNVPKIVGYAEKLKTITSSNLRWTPSKYLHSNGI